MFRSRFIYLFFLLVFKCQFKHVKQLSPLFLVQKMNWKITSIVQWNTNKDAQIHGNSALTAKYRLSTYMVHHWTNPVLHQNFTKRKTIRQSCCIYFQRQFRNVLYLTPGRDAYILRALQQFPCLQSYPFYTNLQSDMEHVQHVCFTGDAWRYWRTAPIYVLHCLYATTIGAPHMNLCDEIASLHKIPYKTLRRKAVAIIQTEYMKCFVIHCCHSIEVHDNITSSLANTTVQKHNGFQSSSLWSTFRDGEYPRAWQVFLCLFYECL